MDLSDPVLRIFGRADFLIQFAIKNKSFVAPNRATRAEIRVFTGSTSETPEQSKQIRPFCPGESAANPLWCSWAKE